MSITITGSKPGRPLLRVTTRHAKFWGACLSVHAHNAIKQPWGAGPGDRYKLELDMMAIRWGSHSPIVLLIGSTGSGKSALGNFLLNPTREHITGNKQTFRTSRSKKPETQFVRCVGDRKPNPTIQVIDTPGLNKGDCEDLAHMSDIVITLRRVQHVSACVLCVNFNAKIDQQWKATAAYYSKLLKKLFESNVVIVMTHFQTDERSIRQREAQGIDADEVTGNVVSAVRECADLTYSPHVFRIDSVPLDEYDRPRSKADRSAILSYIKSLNPVLVSDLRVAKTDALRHKDNEEIGRLHAEINCYSEHLKKVKVGAAPAVRQTQQIERLSRQDEGNAKEIDELMEIIFERRKQIQKLSQAYLSVEEADHIPKLNSQEL